MALGGGTDGPGASGSSFLVARDGTRLAVERRIPGDCRAHVVLVHGYAEHGGRYRQLVGELADAGYGCHLLDLRGHGRSGGPRGAVERFADYRDDLDLLVESAPAEGDSPLFLLGHSLGGLIALDYVLHRPGLFGGLAVSSPFLSPNLPWPVARLAAAAARLMPRLVTRSRIDARWLSHDPEAVRRYVEDPLVFKEIDAHWFREAHEAQRRVYDRAREIRIPSLFLLAGDDRIAGRSRSEAVFRRLGSADKRLEVYAGRYHELFNETDRDRVVAELLGWMFLTSAGTGAPPAAR